MREGLQSIASIQDMRELVMTQLAAPWHCAECLAIPAGALIKRLQKLLSQHTVEESDYNDEHEGLARQLSAPSSQELSDISSTISRIQLAATDPDAVEVLMQLIKWVAPLVMSSSHHIVQADDQVKISYATQ